MFSGCLVVTLSRSHGWTRSSTTAQRTTLQLPQAPNSVADNIRTAEGGKQRSVQPDNSFSGQHYNCRRHTTAQRTTLQQPQAENSVSGKQRSGQLPQAHNSVSV
jgi:hypothetical protein